MKFKTLFRRFDNYGYKLNLNFKKQGEEVKTNIGGLISFLIQFFEFQNSASYIQSYPTRQR